MPTPPLPVELGTEGDTTGPSKQPEKAHLLLRGLSAFAGFCRRHWFLLTLTLLALAAGLAVLAIATIAPPLPFIMLVFGIAASPAFAGLGEGAIQAAVYSLAAAAAASVFVLGGTFYGLVSAASWGIRKAIGAFQNYGRVRSESSDTPDGPGASAATVVDMDIPDLTGKGSDDMETAVQNAFIASMQSSAGTGSSSHRPLKDALRPLTRQSGFFGGFFQSTPKSAPTVADAATMLREVRVDSGSDDGVSGREISRSLHSPRFHQHRPAALNLEEVAGERATPAAHTPTA